MYFGQVKDKHFKTHKQRGSMKGTWAFVALFVFIAANCFALSVYDIQYSGTGDSPYNGQVVTVNAVVVATGYDGNKYFIGDTTGGPYSGVYVFDFTNTVSAGQWIEISATVEEYYGMTELKTVHPSR